MAPKIARMRLTPEEGRVIGSLIEKQLTTPQQYPLTLNSLVLACNQSSNRDPVVSYDEQLVQTTLVSLRSAELIGLIYPSHGRSVTRYRHLLAERLGLDEREMALMAALLLRGAQTAGELRARSERMAQFRRDRRRRHRPGAAQRKGGGAGGAAAPASRPEGGALGGVAHRGRAAIGPGGDARGVRCAGVGGV